MHRLPFKKTKESLFNDLGFVRVYIDDVVIGSKSTEEHTNHGLVLWDRIRESCLNINLKS